jgi:signal transduction histidine kinase
MLVVGADLRLRRFSPCTHRVLNVLPGDVGRSIGDFKLKINVPDLEPLIQEVLDTLAIKELEVADQHGSWYRMVVRPYKTSDLRIDGAVITLLDIDLMKRREKEVAEAAAQEQQRIGQELHDSVGQELTALGLLGESMVESMIDQSHPDAKLAAKITAGLRRVLGEVRAITQGLIPVEVDGAGLMAALTDLAAKVSEHPGVQCVFSCAQPVAIEDNQTATQLYRIAQEAVTNALKHGKPHQIQLELAENAEHFVLRIADDGTGLGGSATTSDGMGLKIMRYRASLINATLTIDSTPEHGTVVACTLTKGNRHEPKQTRKAQRARAGSDR